MSLAKKFNWYPGHIAKAEKELKEKIKIIDLIIELRDARIPKSSIHGDLSRWAGNKPIITLLNKTDLSEISKLRKMVKDSDEKIYLFSTKDSKQFASTLIKDLEKYYNELNAKYKSKGVINKPLKVLIVGYPNVGKSSLINLLSKSKKAKVEDRPGVTRSQQWIDVKTSFNIKLLDTPGIIPPKLYSDDQALKLALCNCVSEQAYDPVEVARLAIELIAKLYPDQIQKYYGLDALEEPSLESIAKAKKILIKQDLDLERAARKFINDFQDAKLGKMLLDII